MAVTLMPRTKGSSTQTMTCPDCGLVLRVVNGSPGFKIVYDRRAWRRVCTRVNLDDAAWCLVQRDGTHPLPAIMDGGDRDRHSVDLVIIGSHCVGLELIIEQLKAEGLAVKAVTATAARPLAQGSVNRRGLWDFTRVKHRRAHGNVSLLRIP